MPVRPWRYRVDLTDVVRTFQDLDEGEIDVEKARRRISSALGRAVEDLVRQGMEEREAEDFRGISEYIKASKDAEELGYALDEIYGLAAAFGVWLSDSAARNRAPKSPSIGALRDLPLPPNAPRPEMWDAEAIVRAVEDGFTFMVPFKIRESLFQPNAYWIGGVQFGACGLTVGPEHTPEMGLTDEGWIWAKTFFRPEMVPERAWLTKRPNEFGVVPVRAEIDPDDIDFEILNRGHQIVG